MNRQKYYLYPDDVQLFQKKLFRWMQQFELFSYLESNNYLYDKYSSYDGLYAIDSASTLSLNSGSAFVQLEKYYSSKKDWLFGYFSYDLKNELEELHSNNEDQLALPDLLFFQPKIVVLIKGSEVVFEFLKNEKKMLQIIEEILNQSIEENAEQLNFPKLKNKVDKENYIKAINEIREKIREGEIYEMNYCQEFFAENVDVNPSKVFSKLNDFSRNPFATFCKFQDVYLMCASPERFLKKVGKTLISQPIKGTIKRGESAVQNEILKEQLKNDPKEQAENVMIVDLVRNDLMKSCETGSVEVEELFGVYTFKSVNHLISTIKGNLEGTTSFIKAIENAFPMGSMTGCPKISAMNLIEKFESSKRGLYSGAVGYIDPNENFDFNVVIRSLIYHQPKKYLSLQIGGAITFDSAAEKEYEECLLKASSVLKVLQ